MHGLARSLLIQIAAGRRPQIEARNRRNGTLEPNIILVSTIIWSPRLHRPVQAESKLAKDS